MTGVRFAADSLMVFPSDCNVVLSVVSCQTSSDCCERIAPDYKRIESCGDHKNCWCINPGQSCFGGFRCCDGSVCNYNCPPADQFNYCHTRYTPNCQLGFTCTVDPVSMRIWPGETGYHGRCL